MVTDTAKAFFLQVWSVLYKAGLAAVVLYFVIAIDLFLLALNFFISIANGSSPISPFTDQATRLIILLLLGLIVFQKLKETQTSTVGADIEVVKTEIKILSQTLEDQKGESITSDYKINKLRKKFYQYHLTKSSKGSWQWMCVVLDFTTPIESMPTEHGRLICRAEQTNDKGGEYPATVEAALRRDRFILFKKPDNGEQTNISVFPYLGQGVHDHHAGICIIETWYKNTPVFTRTIIGEKPIEGWDKPGLVSDEKVALECDDVWMSNSRSTPKPLDLGLRLNDGEAGDEFFAALSSDSVARTYSKYAGIWHGMHISRVGQTDKKIISKHKYDIQVNKSGNIVGSFLDFLADEDPWDYDIDGKFTRNGSILLSAISKLRKDVFSIQIFFNPSPTRLTGLLVSYDYQNRPFFSPIFLARWELSPKEFEDELTRYKPEYYNFVEDFTDYNLPNKQEPKTGQGKGPGSSSSPVNE